MKLEVINLGDAATFINGYPFNPNEWKTKGLEIIRIQNLTGSGKDINYFDGQLNEKYKVRKGDLLISWSATLGIYEWKRKDAWLNQHIFKVVLDKKEIDKSFFKHLVSNLLNKMNQQVHGSTMKHITKERFDKIKIPLPPLPQQKRLAEILDKADLLRQKNKEILAAYDELLQAVFLDMFGDPVRNEKGWEKKTLKEVCVKITDGTHHSPPITERGVPYITAKHVKRYGLDFNVAPSFISEEHHIPIYKRCNPEKGDVLYIKDGATTGIAAINTFEYEVSLLSSLALLKPNYEIISNYYLCFWLNEERIKAQYIKNNMSGSAIQRYTLKKICEFDILIPPINLQNHFAQIVQNIEAQKELVKKSMQESEDLFNGLVQQAFNGELMKNNII